MHNARDTLELSLSYQKPTSARISNEKRRSAKLRGWNLVLNGTIGKNRKRDGKGLGNYVWHWINFSYNLNLIFSFNLLGQFSFSVSLYMSFSPSFLGKKSAPWTLPMSGWYRAHGASEISLSSPHLLFARLTLFFSFSFFSLVSCLIHSGCFGIRVLRPVYWETCVITLWCEHWPTLSSGVTHRLGLQIHGHFNVPVIFGSIQSYLFGLH